MSVELVTAASGQPVNVQSVKTHCRIDSDYEDAYISGLIDAATAYFQNTTNRQLLNATYKLKLGSWPKDSVIRLPYAPLSSVTSIQYYDSAGDLQTWASDNYIVDTGSEPGKVTLTPTATVPTLESRSDALQVTYVVGYGSAATAVPELIKQALRLLVGHWYEHREAVTFGAMADVPMGADNIINQYRVITLY